LMAFYSKKGRGKVDGESRASRGASMASYDKMSAAERQQLIEALASLTGLQEGPDDAFPDGTRYAYDPALKRTVEITPSGQRYPVALVGGKLQRASEKALAQKTAR